MGRIHMPGSARSRPGQRARQFALAVAIAFCAVSPGFAVEEDSNPQASARNPDYAAGKQAFDRQDWGEAVRRFSRATVLDPDNADIHNYLGFSYRKMGQLELAFKYYHRALALNPRHRGAHEYIGEAYLMAGNPDGAQKHLEELRKLCLLPCGELAELEKAVAEYRAKPRTGMR
jgi:Flp pilus assembly protein TadD